MAATPFKGTLTDSLGNSYDFSASDVDGEFVTWDDIPGTPSYIQFPNGARLADLTVSAAGVDTKRLTVTRGTQQTGRILRTPPLVETLAGKNAVDRLGVLRGMPLAPNVQYGLKQS